MNKKWSKGSIALHWLAAAMIVAIAAAGMTMGDMESNSLSRLFLARMHTIGGVALMLVTAARLLVRWRSPKVEPLDVEKLHRRGIGLVHVLLYVVTFALGMTGALTGLRSEWPEYLQGRLASAPDLDAMFSLEVHESLVTLLIVLVVAHISGVIVHQLRKGGVLSRMLPISDAKESHD